MKQGELPQVEQRLQDTPAGGLTVIYDSESRQDHVHPFSAETEGKGRVETYCVFPGIEASYMLFLAPEVSFHHAAFSSVLELFYCRSGRVGWNMRNGTAVYLGAGDLTVHSAVFCSDSAMMFPLGYAEGMSVSVDLHHLSAHCPKLLQKAGFDPQKIQNTLCSGKPSIIPACPELEWIFGPLYSAPNFRRAAYLQIKVLELLLYLTDVHPEEQPLTPYFSQQTERIKEIHQQLTEHLDRRFTIEELSKQYLINTSTLKEVFKAVYGLPIATYMKEYRISRAMKLLRETKIPISEIAGQVGYETQGKFSKAFKDVTQMLPRDYRRNHCTNQTR